MNLSIVGIGNCGTRLVRTFEQKYQPIDGMANVDFSYLDVNDVLFNAIQIPPAQRHIVDGAERGGGKNRNINAAAISAGMPTFLSMHAPADNVILVYSGGGATGSSAGPLAHRFLLKEGRTVISIAIGGTDTMLDVTNSTGMFRSHQLTVQEVERPVALRYLQNAEDGNKLETDLQAQNSLTILCALFGDGHAPMDPMDVRNFIDWTQATKLQPEICAIGIHANSNDVIADNRVISCIGLTGAAEVLSSPGRSIQTFSYGVLNQALQSGQIPALNSPIYLTNSDGVYDRWVADLKQRENAIARILSARVVAKRIDVTDAI